MRTAQFNHRGGHTEEWVCLGEDRADQELRLSWVLRAMDERGTYRASIGLPLRRALSGLDLTSVGGDLDISGNSRLTTLSGLDSLTTVGGDVTIDYYARLTTLAGLELLTTVGGDVSISGNDTLATLSGLDSLTTVGSALDSCYNPYLTTLSPRQSHHDWRPQALR